MHRAGVTGWRRRGRRGNRPSSVLLQVNQTGGQRGGGGLELVGAGVRRQPDRPALPRTTKRGGCAGPRRPPADRARDGAPGPRLVVGAAKLIVGGCPPQTACRAAMVECLSDDPEITSALMEVVMAVFGE